MKTIIKNSHFQRVGLVLIILALSLPGNSQTITGEWKTVNDDTGKAESIMRIWKAKNGLYYGKVLKILETRYVNSVCSECEKSDPRYKKRVQGMTVITKMKKTGKNEWTKGYILDPATGTEYKCKIFREGKNLMVRGYVAFLYRTQKWLPVKK